MGSNNKKAKILTVIGVLTIILTVGGATYAYMNYKDMIGTSTIDGDINATTGTTDSLMLKAEKGMNITVTEDNFTRQRKSNR